MELRHLYFIADLFNEKIKDRTLPDDAKKDIEINIKVYPPTFMGIDKQLYYLTHNNSYEGFVHTENMIKAAIDGITFNIFPKEFKTDKADKTETDEET